MTDPLRRDPAEFLRILKRMSSNTSWQKSMLFASKGRMVGYRMTLDHYNTVLFSQSMWGRALEIIRVIRAMDEDRVQPNGASYYYICNGMANADHGYNYDFNINAKLPALQHWRVALNALEAAETNGFDTTDTMHNSVIISCTIPTINKWETAAAVLHKLLDEQRRMHPTMVKFFRDCLIRNMRPYEATLLETMAAEQRVAGYGPEKRTAPAVLRRLREQSQLQSQIQQQQQQQERQQLPSSSSLSPSEAAEVVTTSDATSSSSSRSSSAALSPEEEAALREEQSRPAFFTSGIHATEIDSTFRPRVYRQEWYKWHAIANKYRPQYALRKKQLAPRDSPSGIPGFHRL